MTESIGSSAALPGGSGSVEGEVGMADLDGDEGGNVTWRGGKVSSFAVLLFAFLSFFLFAVAEIFGAWFSHSLSLLGDATTMIVDSVTYLFNMYAEYKKPGQFVKCRCVMSRWDSVATGRMRSSILAY